MKNEHGYSKAQYETWQIHSIYYFVTWKNEETIYLEPNKFITICKAKYWHLGNTKPDKLIVGCLGLGGQLFYNVNETWWINGYNSITTLKSKEAMWNRIILLLFFYTMKKWGGNWSPNKSLLKKKFNKIKEFDPDWFFPLLSWCSWQWPRLLERANYDRSNPRSKKE